MSSLFKKRHKVAFDTQTVAKGHYSVTYRGIETQKCPFDYVIYQMLLWEIKPDLIIEIGTNKGGSALYLADILDIIGKGQIHGIDIVKNQLDPLVEKHPRIKRFTDGYQGYDVALAKGYEKVLVIEDGSHTYEDTIAAIRKFAPVVTVGSYLVVEDGIVDELNLKEDYHGGPLKAIDEFIPSNDSFIIDRKWCDMFGTNATFNVDGYLKKIKQG